MASNKTWGETTVPEALEELATLITDSATEIAKEIERRRAA